MATTPKSQPAGSQSFENIRSRGVGHEAASAALARIRDKAASMVGAS
jgi:hypothetical protein